MCRLSHLLKSQSERWGWHEWESMMSLPFSVSGGGIVAAGGTRFDGAQRCQWGGVLIISFPSPSLPHYHLLWGPGEGWRWNRELSDPKNLSWKWLGCSGWEDGTARLHNNLHPKSPSNSYWQKKPLLFPLWTLFFQNFGSSPPLFSLLRLFWWVGSLIK